LNQQNRKLKPAELDHRTPNEVFKNVRKFTESVFPSHKKTKSQRREPHGFDKKQSFTIHSFLFLPPVIRIFFSNRSSYST